MLELIVHHPARRSIAELFTKWDRHISHDFAEWQLDGRGRVRWFHRAAAVVISPFFGLYKISASTRIADGRSRMLAAVAFVSISHLSSSTDDRNGP